MLKDQDIREPLCEFLELKYGKIRIIEEKQIGKSRADMMMVTEDALYGIEIKSDADTYARLERQVKDYNRFFDSNILVVGSKHASHAAEHVPQYWGIVSVEEQERADFYLIREPAPNPKREKKVKLRNQLSFLWRMELAHIQEINHMPKYAQMSKMNVMLKIMEKVDEPLLKKQICAELFERDYTNVQERINAYKEQLQEKSRKNQEGMARRKTRTKQAK